MNTHVTLWLCLKLMFHDVEDDGTHLYLVVQPHDGNTREYMVAFDNPVDVKWQDGCYEVEAECNLETRALDPPNKHDEGMGSFGYPRIAPICNAIRIERRGFLWRAKWK
jgi:hypothetical protein